MLRLTLLLTFVKRSVNKCFEHLYDAKLLKLWLPSFFILVNCDCTGWEGKNKKDKNIKNEIVTALRWEGGFRGEHQGERRPRNHDDAPEGEKDILKEKDS